MLNTDQYLPVAMTYFNGISFQLERCPVTNLLIQDAFRAMKSLLISTISNPPLSYESIITFFSLYLIYHSI